MITPELILGLTNSLISPKFDPALKTPDFHMELWDLACSSHPRVAIAAPRGHAKSTAGTHCFTLACILFRERQHILIVSDTEGQSCSFLGDLKNEFLENEELIELFGVRGLLKDRENEFIVQFNDGFQVRVVAKGSEQKLRGLKWRHKRPDLIICDDLENDEIVMNDERRVKFREWFFKALLPCGSSNCIIRVFGTILHLDSLLERLMPQLGLTTTVEDGLKQTSTVESSWKSVRYKAHNDDFSLVLWPEQYSETRLRDVRQMFIEQGNPEGYSQEYLNYPIDPTTAYFRKKDFIPLVKDEQPEEYYIACDLAISQKDRTAFTVFVVAGLNSSGKLRIRDVMRFRGDSLEIIDEMFSTYSRWKPQMIFIEQENIARTLGPILNKEMEERGVYLPLQEMTASQDKIKRARALQARMRAGMVEFDFEAEWFPVYQQELLTFPRGAYMDQVDATAWIALGLDKLYDTPTLKDLDYAQYEEDKEDAEELFFGGMNRYTGY